MSQLLATSEAFLHAWTQDCMGQQVFGALFPHVTRAKWPFRPAVLNMSYKSRLKLRREADVTAFSLSFSLSHIYP